MANLLEDVDDFLTAPDEAKEEPVDEQPEPDTETETVEKADTGTETEEGEPDPIYKTWQELELEKHYPGGPEAALRSIPEHRRHNEQLRKEMQEREERLRQYEADNREMFRAIQQRQSQQQQGYGIDFDEDPRAFIEQNYIPRQVGQQLYEYVLGMEQRLNEIQGRTSEQQFASQHKDFDQVRDEVNDVIRQDPYLAQMPRERALELAYLKVQAPRWQQAMSQAPPQPKPVAPADNNKKQYAQTTPGKGGRQPVQPTSYQQMWDTLDISEWEKKYGEPR